MRNYINGFILSIILTLAAFTLVINHLLVGWSLIIVVIGLALVQLWVQLVFFLHLDQEKGPRWNLVILLSTFSIVLVIVVASLWIMNNLNYHMTPMETNSYLLQEEGIKK